MASDNLSPKDVQHILNSNRCEIVSAIKMNIRSLLDYLIEDNAVSPQVYDRIKAEKVPLDQARDLLDHVSSVGEKAFLSLKRGLQETKCDSLLLAIEAEEENRKKEKAAEKRKRRPRASWPSPTPSNPPSGRPKSWTVRNLTAYWERSNASAQSYSEHYSGRANNDCGRRGFCFTSEDMYVSSESFKSDRCTQQESSSVAGSSVTCNMTSDFSEDNIPGETKVKQVADSLNDLNIGWHAYAGSACANISQTKHVNMLLVGCKENGKSSTGNSILGEKCFKSKRRGGTCNASLRAGSFQGQCANVIWNVNVVDTPGISHEMTKSEFEEVVGGVKMLSDDNYLRELATSQRTPGLDAIILIWSYYHSDRNAEGEVLAFQSLHRLFGDALYEHLVIVVTHAPHRISVEDYVEELPASLREIERSCSGRLVTFDNNESNLEEIQQSREELCNIAYSLSKGNRHRYTVLDLSPMCIIPQGSELRLALMGKTGVGKSSTGNSIIGCEKFTISCAASSVTSDCPYHTRRKPRKVAVVDSPGVMCNDRGVYDRGRLVDQLSSIATIYNTKGLHAMLLVISGRQRFTQEDKDTVQCLRSVFGDRLLQDYTIIVITSKDEIEADKNFSGDVETYLCNAPKALQQVLRLCKHRVVFFNNKTRDETIQRMQLAKLIRKIDGLVQMNGGPYIDDNFMEGKAVAGNIEARSKLSTKAKSTSQLPVTSNSLTSFHFSDEKSHSEDLEVIILPPGSLSSLQQTRPKQPLPVSTRAKSIPGLRARSISAMSFSFRDESFSEEGGLPGAVTESDDETFIEDLRSLHRNQTPVSLVEDQSRSSDIMQSQESLDDPCIEASASPLSDVRQSEETIHRQNDITQERVRHVAALSNLRLTKLWRTIRRKLRKRRKRNSVVPVS